MQQYDFQTELVSIGKFYQDTACAMIANLVNEGVLIKEGLKLRLNESATNNNNKPSSKYNYNECTDDLGYKFPLING